MQLQAVYGDVGVKLEVPKETAAAAAGRTAGATNGAAAMLSTAVSVSDMWMQ